MNATQARLKAVMTERELADGTPEREALVADTISGFSRWEMCCLHFLFIFGTRRMKESYTDRLTMREMQRIAKERNDA